jgi:hypothetical protein
VGCPLDEQHLPIQRVDDDENRNRGFVGRHDGLI